ncbi:two-component system KDP operon response regulator KdpE [Plasticicumulans lactativorans]|uniref:Two-component system KDP operon response regulator KdpE n=1 Tax=Plasticicumulans lactativorans TaxID=1133106 RepID=A0A4R2L448_9GAMM|nr:response regulator [Plasticicumulans lactativorans]TCO81206.1 two-component system KDP operon response regulator KdpE [Plasticicumulans lactativorans]
MDEPRRTVLVIEDELPIRRFLRAALGAQQLHVVEAANGADGLALAASAAPDVILLDLGLPDIDGLEVLARLREWSTVPVIVLSARGQEADKVRGLDAGADDYLGKPFGVPELAARIRVALRHGDREAAPASVYANAGLRIDLHSRAVTRDGVPLHLSPRQYRVLAVLARHAGRVVTHAQLLREVWGEASDASPDYVRIAIHELRHRLEPDPVRPRWLRTEPGVGYRLIDDAGG